MNTPTQTSLLKQFRGLLPYAVGNMWRARWPSLTIIACVLLVIVILNAFLSMARGFSATARSAGSDSIAIVLGRGSQSEANSSVSPEQIALLASARGIAGKPSAELTMTVSGKEKGKQQKINSTLRGLPEAGLQLREGFRIVEGRSFTPGKYELLVGRKLSETVAGAEVGRTIVLAGRTWTVVGKYALDSAVFESEYLADIGAVQSAYGRQNQYQSVRVRLAQAGGLQPLQAFIDADARLDLTAQTERQLYREQVKDTSAIIMYLGWPLAAILSVGALAGVLNTMLIVLEGRQRSLNVLRMLGFSPRAVLFSVLFETVLLAWIGALLGTGLVYLAAQGHEATLMGGGFTTITYHLDIDAMALLQSLALAAAIGVAGGLVPGWKITHAKGRNA